MLPVLRRFDAQRLSLLGPRGGKLLDVGAGRGRFVLSARAGFQPERVEHRLLEHNPFGMWQSIVNRLTLTPSYLYNLLKRNAPLLSTDALVTEAALPLAPLAAGLEAVAGRAGHGGTIAVLARRLPDPPGLTDPRYATDPPGVAEPPTQPE